MMTNDAMPMTTARARTPAPDSSSPWTDLFNQLGPAVLGGAGTYASGRQLQGYTNDAVNAAGYKPTTISGPGGGITPQRNPDGSISYGVSGTGASALGPLSQFAGGAAGAGTDVLSAFKNFNPQQLAQDQYTNLASLQAPTNTNQTQQMLNYEQRTGRGGLTQNGQLGDLGGLDLSQRLGDTGLRMQAEQLASQRQSQLADTASRLGGAGTTALGGVSNYNSSLMDMLRTAMTGSTGQAYAGANQGRMMYDTGMARANQTGNLFGSTLQGLANSGGGLGSSLSSIFNSLRGAFGGAGAASPSDLYGTPGGMMTPGNISSGYADNTNDTGFYDANQNNFGNYTPPDQNFDPSALLQGSPYDTGTGFSSAGGEAAAPPSGEVDPLVSQGYASNNPFYGAGGGASGATNGGLSAAPSNPMGGLNAALNDASSGLNIYNGLQRGGVAGYGSAALSGTKLYDSLSGTTSQPWLGPAGNVLGIYNGIKQGGVAGYGSAAMNAAGLYSAASAANVAAGGAAYAGAGALGGAMATLGPLGLIAGLGMWAGQNPEGTLNLNKDWFHKMGTSLQQPDSADQATQMKKQGAYQELVGMLANGEPTPYTPAQLASFGITPSIVQGYTKAAASYKGPMALAGGGHTTIYQN